MKKLLIVVFLILAISCNVYADKEDIVVKFINDDLTKISNDINLNAKNIFNK